MKFYPRGDVGDIQFSRRGSPTQLRGEGIAMEDNNNDAGDDTDSVRRRQRRVSRGGNANKWGPS